MAGLLPDGTVLFVGNNDSGQGDVQGWSGVTAIAAGNFHSVGLLEDGTAVACGANGHGQCDVAGWKNIEAIAAGGYYTIGLKAQES